MASDKIVTQTPPDAERVRDPLYYYTLLFLAFIQGLFKNRSEGSFKYSEDEELTEIVIADQITNTKETVPRIITARGPAQIIPIALDDMVTKKSRIDERKRTVLISIPMTFNCIAKIGVEAQEITFFLAHNIWAHRVLLQKWGIHRIDKNFSMSPETPTGAVFAPEVVPEGVMLSLVVPFIIRWTSTMVPNNHPKLREIDSYIRTKIGTPQDRLKNPNNDDISKMVLTDPSLIKIIAK